MINFDNVSFKYKNKKIIENISFSINDGECVVFAGKNGSGKTTILKLIAGIIDKYDGKIDRPKNISYIPQDISLIDDMTLYENIDLFYSLKNKMVPKDLPFSLNDYKNVLVSNLSGGIAKMASIVCALTDYADLVLYDEPCANLDIVYTEKIKNLIKTQKENKKTIIYVSHVYNEFKDFFDKLYFVNDSGIKIYDKNNINEEKFIKENL